MHFCVLLVTTTGPVTLCMMRAFEHPILVQFPSLWIRILFEPNTPTAYSRLELPLLPSNFRRRTSRKRGAAARCWHREFKRHCHGFRRWCNWSRENQFWRWRWRPFRRGSWRRGFAFGFPFPGALRLRLRFRGNWRRLRLRRGPSIFGPEQCPRIIL